MFWPVSLNVKRTVRRVKIRFVMQFRSSIQYQWPPYLPCTNESTATN